MSSAVILLICASSPAEIAGSQHCEHLSTMSESSPIAPARRKQVLRVLFISLLLDLVCPPPAAAELFH